MARTPQVTSRLQSPVARQKRKPSDVSATKPVPVINIKYARQIEHHKKYLRKPESDEYDYDYSKYPDEYWNEPNRNMLDLI